MKSVYTGGEKVAEFESYDELRVGDGKPAFIYEGNELVYPNPVKDGLILWYDFSGRTNADGQRGVAEDLSGNGNHGTLQNFNYTAESGYDKNKLLFDGVDDEIRDVTEPKEIYTLEVVAKINPGKSSTWSGIFGNYNHSASGKGRSGFNISTLFNGTSNRMYIRGVFTNNNGEQALMDFMIPVDKEDEAHHIILVNRGDVMTLYVNGNPEAESNQGFFPINEDSVGLTLGVWGTYNPYKLYGEIYSSKAYNRPLTPEEIAHNYEIEKERFGIE